MSGAVGAGGRPLALAAALLGLTAVVLAALGSHAIDMTAQPQLRYIWQTASMMQMFHAAALLALAALQADHPFLRRGAWLLVAGTVVFSGSLYLRVLLAMASAPLAPFGGVLLITGWFLLALALLRKR